MNSKDEHFFKKYFPEGSILYCYELWNRYKIQFTVTKPRKSVYGNYRYFHGIHRITVNGDLKPPAFLVTFLHEVAHLEVQEKYGRAHKPHGREWQDCFRNLLLPMIEAGIFEPETGQALLNHIQNPKSTSCSDPELHKLLSHKDQEAFEGEMSVQELPPGSQFVYDGRTFLLRSKMRTRYDCLELKTGRIFRFMGLARVRILDAERQAITTDSEPSKRPVHQMAPGEIFLLHGRKFSMVEKRRTRFLVSEVETGKQFLVDQHALAESLPA